MNQNQTFDVIIIGRGITGASAAWHLSKLGYRNILMIGPDRTAANCASQCPGFVTAATIDNITRIVHGHGAELAEAILKLGQRGYDGIKSFAESQKIAWAEGTVRRFAPTDHEKNEMNQAVEILKKLKFDANIADPRPDKDPAKTVAIQRDGISSAVTNSNLVLTALEQHSKAKIERTEVSHLTVDEKKIAVHADGKTLTAEMVVIAAHLHTGQLIPNLKDALVSFADQWISFEVEPSSNPLAPGDFWIGHHGHYGVWCGYDNRIYITGARFMRHWAGIEATSAEVFEKITNHLIQKGEEWFGFKSIRNIEAHGILDCRPCDELPVIGPMYGQNRVLVGVGYMGSGLALGFAAGEALADLIHKGKAPQLHSGLTPGRLRSL